MTQKTHTPGPWETSACCGPPGAGIRWDVCMEGAGDMIADLSGCDNAEANARLIAAAPDLLAALESIALSYPETDEGECLAGIARAAIRKAKGE